MLARCEGRRAYLAITREMSKQRASKREATKKATVHVSVPLLTLTPYLLPAKHWITYLDDSASFSTLYFTIFDFLSNGLAMFTDPLGRNVTRNEGV